MKKLKTTLRIIYSIHQKGNSMRILIGISHPKQVYMFKYLISTMNAKGHDVKVVLVEKEITGYLLEKFNIKYERIGKNQSTLFKKIINLAMWEYRTLRIAHEFKPDIFIGQALPHFAHVSALLKKPFIVFEDTEHVQNLHKIVLPFTSAIVTSESFKIDFGKKQVRFNGYFELAYLHPDHFRPDPSVLCNLNLRQDDVFIILRFVSWNAIHDVGQKRLSFEMKLKLVKELEKYGKVFISSETALPDEFENYRITAAPETMHDLLSYATLYIGEGGTMASEAAVLGTPAIYINNLRTGYIDEEEKKYGLIFSFSEVEKSYDEILRTAIELLEQDDLKGRWAKKRENMLKDKIDVSKFMIEFVENFPEISSKLKI